MRLHQTWTLAIFALSILNGAAFAEVTVSQSNDPAALIGTQFASLMGAEHKAVKTLSEDKRALLATRQKSRRQKRPRQARPKPRLRLNIATPFWRTCPKQAVMSNGNA